MRAVPEWIAEHDDQAIPDRVRLRVFLRFKGRCPKCTRALVPGKWACDHIQALENNGEHREVNLQPLCISPCHSNKTKDDRRIKAKADKIAKRDAGIRKRSRWPGAKDSPWKAKVGGGWERRA